MMYIFIPKGHSFFIGGLALVCAIFTSISAQAATEIIYNHSDEPKEALALDILKLVLKHDPKGEEYTYRSLDEGVDEARLLEMTKDGKVTVMWAGDQELYRQELHAIPIPLFKGLLGHRVFLIRKGDQPKFDAVKSLDDLKKLKVGQGRFWGDSAILENSGFNLITAVRYESLFSMLDGGRIDYFPRAIHEPWSEMAGRSSMELEVEKNILLVYPFAMNFFVAKGNDTLAEAIEQGFLAAIENGSYNELFFNHPLIKNALDKAKLENRTVYRIPNPGVSEEMPLDKRELWLDIDNLK